MLLRLLVNKQSKASRSLCTPSQGRGVPPPCPSWSLRALQELLGAFLRRRIPIKGTKMPILGTR